MAKRKQKAIGGFLSKAAKKSRKTDAIRSAKLDDSLDKKKAIKLDRMKKQLIKAEDELEYLTRNAIDDSRIDEEEFLTELIDEIETDIVMLEEGISEEEARGLFKKGGKINKGIEALRKEAPEVVARMGYGLGGLISRSVNALISKRQKLIDKAYKTNSKSKEIKNLEKKITQAQKKYNKEIERNEEGFGPEEDYFGENSIESEFEFEMTVGSSQEQIDEILVALMPKADRKKYDELTELINFKKERLSVRDYDMDDSDFDVMDSSDPLGFRSFKSNQRRAAENKANAAAIDKQERLAEKSYYQSIEGEPDDDIPFAEGGDVDKQMVGLGISVSPITADMESDEDMEDGYVDFIVGESLSPEEETQLMNKLEADPELSVMFDKVLDKATEFAGSGPVEGPGSGVSDSIPARLSDGEFVFTAKATEQIGADRLQRMMEDAEMQAGAGRQQKQEGGEVEETKVDRFGKPVDKDIAEDEIKKGMMSTNPRLQ